MTEDRDPVVSLALWGSAAVFAVIGAAFFGSPAATATLVELRVGSAMADSDVRAVFGGLQLGAAVLLVVCARRDAWRRPGVLALLCLFGGLLAGRLLSLLVVGPPSRIGGLLTLGEVLGLALACVAWRRSTEV